MQSFNPLVFFEFDVPVTFHVTAHNEHEAKNIVQMAAGDTVREHRLVSIGAVGQAVKAEHPHRRASDRTRLEFIAKEGDHLISEGKY